MRIIEGNYSARRVEALAYNQPPDLAERINIWKLEEKKTDVNIALHLYRDAILGQTNNVVLCTNDTDMEPALTLLKKDFPYIKTGLVIPVKPPQKGQRKLRPAQTELSRLTDWTRNYINEKELQNSLLPDSIPTAKKPIKKPDYW